MLVTFLLSATPILLLGVGLYSLIYLRGFCFLQPFRCIRLLFGGKRTGGISPFRALTVALAGTLGVGNIVGSVRKQGVRAHPQGWRRDYADGQVRAHLRDVQQAALLDRGGESSAVPRSQVRHARKGRDRPCPRPALHL